MNRNVLRDTDLVENLIFLGCYELKENAENPQQPRYCNHRQAMRHNVTGHSGKTA